MKSFKQYVQMLTEAKGTPWPRGFNKGYAYEFVIAAAMVARFTDRYDNGEPMPLTFTSVMRVMAKFQGGWDVWKVAEGDEKVDIVEFDGEGLPKSVHDRWGDYQDHPETGKMIKSAIEAVKGNQTLTKLSLDVITNQRADEIVIKCVGTKGQHKTKSDVDVYVNNKDMRIKGFSVKWENTKSAAQNAGVDTVKNLTNGFKRFGLTVGVSGVKKAVEEIQKNGRGGGIYSTPSGNSAGLRNDENVKLDKKIMYPVVRSAFVTAAKKYTTELKNEARKVRTPKLDAIMKGLREANVGDEDDVEVFRGKSITYNEKTFEDFGVYIRDAAKQGQAQWKCEKDSEGNPALGLYANKHKMFQLRFRFGADPVAGTAKKQYKVRWRLVIENGSHLDTLAKRK